MNDILKSLKANLYERIVSPLSGAIIFSWIIWNWKFLYYLLYGKGDVILKLKYIEENYFNSLNLYVFPIISAIALIWLYPYATRFFYKIWLQHKVELKKRKNEIEKNTLLTKEESISYIIALDKLDKKYADMLNKKDNEIKMLKETINGVSEKDSLNIDSEEKIIKNKYNELKESKYFENFIDIYNQMNKSKYIKDEFNPDILNYFVSIEILNRNDDSNPWYNYTKIGEKLVGIYLKEKGLNTTRPEPQKSSVSVSFKKDKFAKF